MVLRVLLILLAVLACGLTAYSVSRLDSIREEHLATEDELWKLAAAPETNALVDAGIPPEILLIRRYQKFGDRLQEAYPEDVTDHLEFIEGVWIWARTYTHLRSIYALYEQFRKFQKLQTDRDRVPSPRQAWIDLSNTILNDGASSVPDALDEIEKSITDERLFREVLKDLEEKPCGAKLSAHQILTRLYQTIAVTDLKGYAMVQFAQMLLTLFEKGNYTEDALETRLTYHQRAGAVLAQARTQLEYASREIWNCDPPKHIKDKTYTEVTELLQGYIQNEVDLNPKGTCTENCAHYTYTKSHGCFKNLYCREQRRCNGKIVNCQFVDSDMWICPATQSSGRRYNYVEYENGRILGRKTSCSTRKVDSWWRWLFWHCSYCICLCDEESLTSDRYISLKTVLANSKKNGVVTGMRFIKKNRIIHLQVQEGQLLPDGRINSSTVGWVPLNEFKITDEKVYEDQDFHTLSWEERAIDLDNLKAPDDHLIIGLKFKKLGPHLNLELLAAPFNYTTGHVDYNKQVWISNDNTDASMFNPRRRLRLDNPDVPTRTYEASFVDSSHDQYVEFTNSDFDKDVAQTTVPFIDIQPVVSSLPSPLVGGGIYHKGRPNFGGFIAPKIITYDHSKHLKLVFPAAKLNQLR